MLVGRCAVALAFFLFLALTALAVRAVVTLKSFVGVPGDGYIAVEWETGSEYDTAGFFIQRSLQSSGVYSTISPFIRAEGDSITGAQYSFTDTTVTNGVTYFYMLEELTNSQGANLYGPITVTAGLPTPTPTPTATPGILATPRTPRPTETPTPTSISALVGTPAPTNTSTPDRTRTPNPTGSSPLATPSQTGAPLASGTSQGLITQGAHTPTSIPAGMAPIVTATAAALSTSNANATAARSSALASPLPTAIPSGTVAQSSTSSEVNSTRPAPEPSLQPSRAPTAVSENQNPTAVAGAGQRGSRSSGATTEISGGTNWFGLGLAIALIAAAVLLVLGAIFVVRSLLSR
jgi:hypothetical protein